MPRTECHVDRRDTPERGTCFTRTPRGKGAARFRDPARGGRGSPVRVSGRAARVSAGTAATLGGRPISSAPCGAGHEGECVVGRHSNAETIAADGVENGVENKGPRTGPRAAPWRAGRPTGPSGAGSRWPCARPVPHRRCPGSGSTRRRCPCAPRARPLRRWRLPPWHPVAPASRPGWRERRAARHELAAQVDLAARLSRAEHRSRMVSAFPVARPVSTRPTPPRP